MPESYDKATHTSFTLFVLVLSATVLVLVLDGDHVTDADGAKLPICSRLPNGLNRTAFEYEYRVAEYEKRRARVLRGGDCSGVVPESIIGASTPCILGNAMNSPSIESKPKLLVTDLDGTLIPFPDVPENGEDLATLHEELQCGSVEIAFATGRHIGSVIRAIEEFGLPTPGWVVCDVGTCVHLRSSSGRLEVAESYRCELRRSTSGQDVHGLRGELLALDAALSMQEEAKQREFKLSFYVDTPAMLKCVSAIESRLRQREAPFDVIHSLDPWQPRGLIDVIPSGASKASAVAWWAAQHDVPLASVVYAGDSGNDFAPLAAGCCAIVVANAEASLVAQLEAEHRRQAWQERLYVANGKATSGVLEGCYWFGLFQDEFDRRKTLG